MNMFGVFIYDFLFFAIPVLSIIFFGISLYRFCSAKSANKKSPESFPPSEIKKRLILLIVSSVIMSVLLFIVIGLIVILLMVIAYM